MEQTQKQYLRQTRTPSPETRQKISQTLAGRKKTPEHCRNISTGLKDYWSHIPKGPEDNPISRGDIV